MGVEPTRDRLTAPPGFEVRSPHRERDSSMGLRHFGRKELDTRRIDASQVLPADGETVPIKEFQDLDRYFTAIVQAIAEICRRERAVGRARSNLHGNLGHALHDGSQEKMVVGDLLEVAPTRGHAHQATDESFIDAHAIADIADARRPIWLASQLWADERPDALLLVGKFHVMAG